MLVMTVKEKSQMATVFTQLHLRIYFYMFMFMLYKTETTFNN